MSAEAGEPCELLPWDSEFFGFAVARVRSSELDDAGLRRVDEWCEARAVRLLYFLARWDDVKTAGLVWRRNGFLLTGVRLTYEMSPVRAIDVDPEPFIRPVRAVDAPHLEQMTAGMFHHSRFYQDPRIPSAKADELFATWVTKSCRGYADEVFVAAHPEMGQPIGFVTCHWDARDRDASIGLIGVAPHARGHGVGRALVASAVRWSLERGARAVGVVTQQSNHSSKQLYERCGFALRRVEPHYHKWYGGTP